MSFMDLYSFYKLFSEADEGGKGYLLRHEVKVAMVELLGYKPTKVNELSWFCI